MRLRPGTNWIRVGLLCALTVVSLRADVTYTKTLRFTGGSMLGFLRNLLGSPLLDRLTGGDFQAALDDQSYTIYVKGSRMAQVNESGSTIYDLEGDGIISVDQGRRTYSVETFEQVRAKIARAQKWIDHSEEGVEPFRVTVEKTGRIRQEGSRTATESVVTLSAQDGGALGRPVIRDTTWLLPVDTALSPLSAFAQRAAQKLSTSFTLLPGLFGAAAGSGLDNGEFRKLAGISTLDQITVSGITAGLAGLLGAQRDRPDGPALQLRIDSSHFSFAPVDNSRFAVPAGYQQEAPN